MSIAYHLIGILFNFVRRWVNSKALKSTKYLFILFCPTDWCLVSAFVLLTCSVCPIPSRHHSNTEVSTYLILSDQAFTMGQSIIQFNLDYSTLQASRRCRSRRL